MKTDLDKEFESAFVKASSSTIKLPPDVMLKLYAYYKQATSGSNYKSANGDVELINAFKLNAWLQLTSLTEDEAKQGYIDLVNKHILKK
ncbi:MAG TPA: acyl-CoA-binding protein [Flavobacteriaceae bacterium]|nr:acyl-CoA-binding protein [Flavobacteriaceae bacterium]HEX5743717.1 acyl-CoA-binding protein [Flavobacteriaceae bacterium]